MKSQKNNNMENGKKGIVIMTDDEDGNPVEYTMENIVKEMDAGTEFGKEFGNMLDKVLERMKEIKQAKDIKLRNLLIREKARMCLETVQTVGKKDTEWEKNYYKMILILVQDINLLTK